MIVEAHFPVLPAGAGAAFDEFTRRHGDYAIAAVGAIVGFGPDGRAKDVRVATCGIGSRPMRLREAEALLEGTEVDGQGPRRRRRGGEGSGHRAGRHACDDILSAAGGCDPRPPCGRDGGETRQTRTLKRMPRTRRRLSVPSVSSDPKARVSITVNGEQVERDVSVRLLLSDFLRHELRLTGTHVGCEHGVCGACTVLIDGKAGRSCLTFAVQASGHEVRTIESLADEDGTLHPIQDAFQDCHALQCGYCTPGMIMNIVGLFESGEPLDLTDEGIRLALSGNLCRCTGYQNIVAAVRKAADAHAGGTGVEMSTRAFGSRIKRTIDPTLLRGEGAFVDDIPLANPLHAAFVRSPYARARITSIDVTAARAHPGVVAVYTGEDIGVLDREMPLLIPHPSMTDARTQRPLGQGRRLLCRPDGGDGGGGRPLHRRGRRGAGRGRVRRAAGRRSTSRMR